MGCLLQYNLKSELKIERPSSWRSSQQGRHSVVQDPTRPETIKSGRKRGQDSIAFFRWFTQANNFEPGLVDTLAEIIRDQLWVNPLEFMDAEEDTEVCIIR